MLEEGDGRCAVDDDVHLSAQPRQLSQPKATVGPVHIALQDNNLVEDSAERLLGLGVLLEQGPCLEKALQPLLACWQQRPDQVRHMLEMAWELLQAKAHLAVLSFPDSDRDSPALKSYRHVP